MRATGHELGNSCWTYEYGEMKWRWERTWRDPGFSQSELEPVVCVNWADAQAYVAWLSETTGARYRLPSEAEWEYAARAGTQTARYWGDGAAGGCTYANAADSTLKEEHRGWAVAACRDGEVNTSLVGSYRANAFGLHDMLGNVWEWVEDCWHDDYTGAPSDGEAWTSDGDCERRVLRGGSWSHGPRNVRSANRNWSDRDNRLFNNGFRVVRALER